MAFREMVMQDSAEFWVGSKYIQTGVCRVKNIKDLVWDPLRPEKKNKQGKGINLGLNGILGIWNKLIAHPHKCIPDGQ